MPCNGEDKAGKEHTQRDDNSPREGITERAIDKPALKPNESRKNDQWRWQHVPDGNAIQENILREPATFQNGFDLNERNGRICTSERQAARNQTQKEEIDK
jgi:hypothetical protein